MRGMKSIRNESLRKNQMIYVPERSSLDSEWSRTVPVGDYINTARYHDGAPSISLDGNMLLCRSKCPGGMGHQDIWRVTSHPMIRRKCRQFNEMYTTA